jgi:membrane protease YdiL (CAAX protease family)
MTRVAIHKSDSRARLKAIVSLLAIAIILSIDAYHRLFSVTLLDDLFLYLVIPLLIILLIFRENPIRYGLTLGHWKESLAWTLGGMVLMAATAWGFMQLPDFRDYYVHYYTALRNPEGSFWHGVAMSGLQMFAWEFLFRGFLLFALAELFGPYAIWIQMVPFAMAHFGKPELETYSSIAGGVLSGWVAYRVKSFYPSWIIHWALAVGISLLLAVG